MTTDFAQQFAERGYFVTEGVLDGADVEGLREAIGRIPEGDSLARRNGVYGARNLLTAVPEVRQLAADERVRQWVTPILGAGAFAVRAVFFDKVPGANWSLHYHQDHVIAVADRLDLPGYVGRSNKSGV